MFFLFYGQKMQKVISQLKREYIVWNWFCLETNFSYTYLSSFRNFFILSFKKSKTCISWDEMLHLQNFESDVQFLKNEKFVNFVCLTVLKDVYMQDYLTTKDWNLFAKKKRSPHGMQVVRPTECRCKLGTKYSLYVKDEVG